MSVFDRVCRAVAVSARRGGLRGGRHGSLGSLGPGAQGEVDHLAGTADQGIGARARVAPVRRGGEKAPARPARSRRRAGAAARADKAMSGMVEQNAGMVRTRLGELRDALVALPQTLCATSSRSWTTRRGLPCYRSSAAILLAARWSSPGWRSACYDLALRNYRKRLVPPAAETFTARAFRLGSRSRPGPCRDRRVRACLARDIPRALAGARPAADRDTGVADRGRRRAGDLALRRVPAFEPRRGGAAPAVRRRPGAAVCAGSPFCSPRSGASAISVARYSRARERARRRSISC